MNMTEIIAKKRDGGTLSEAEITFFISGVVNGSIPDYQSSALLMAIYLNKMNPRETAFLTRCMMESGDQIDLSKIPGIKVDKHSTGGVGDKTTLVLTPLVAACGVPVAKMTGKGLGHTGGTMDKLESFKGIRTALNQKEFIKQVKKIGLAVSGQSGNLVPADQQLYALRDVTSTVDNLSLISASIMSKKLASGSDAIVLDVKVGNGGFNPTVAAARKLAKTMIRIGQQMERQTVAVISRMDQPLGRAVGNSLEVIEAIETLKGNGPKDLVDLSLELGVQMLILSGKYSNKTAARKMLKQQLNSGAALKMFKKFIKAQGGDVSPIIDYDRFPGAKYKLEVNSPKSGWINELTARTIGLGSMQLGAGRQKKSDPIDLGAGIYLHKKIGEKVETGERLATLYTNKKKTLNEVADLILPAWSIGLKKGKVKSVIVEVL